MILRTEKQIVLPAWSISVLLHGLVLGLSVTLSGQIKPVLQEDVFQWDVALVDGVSAESRLESATSSILQKLSEAKTQPLPSTTRSSDRAHHMKQVRQSEEKVALSQPPVEAVHPRESKVESPQRQEEPAEQPLIERVESKMEPEAVAVSSESTAVQPIQQEQVGVTPASVISHAEQGAQAVAEDAVLQNQAASVVSAPSSDVKTDNRWLVESLWRRVAELKRYPSSARLNGQEGKVIVRAVIRSDGQLADVMVQKSSGHSVLDAAALEAVKLACPIHMKQTIGKSQIVVTLPIVYQLSG